MKIERFNEYNAGPKCPVCSSRMYITDRGWHQVTYHCSSDEARFWDFPRGSKDQMISKKHWDESRVEICKNIDEGMSKKSVTKSIFGKIIELNSSNIDGYIDYYNKHLDHFKLRKSFLVDSYQQIVDELISIKKENNWL